MKARIQINTNLPSGNACIIELRQNSDVPEVHFMPSPAGGPEAMWFNFLVEPTTEPAPQAVRCVLHLADTLLGGGDGKGSLIPVYQTEKQSWTRVTQVQRQERPDGRPVHTWVVPLDGGAAQVALCYPYGEAELKALTDATSLASSVIGCTHQHRLLMRLSNTAGEPGSARPGIYCVARQHAGETPGSWVLDGFLREMATAGSQAPLVWAVPFIDFDGVVAGYYGKDRFPYDFNRSWGSKLFPEDKQDEMGSHPMRYEVGCLQKDIVHWRQRCRPLLVLDFHGPSLFESDGIYAFLRDVDEQGQPDQRHRPWVEAFQRALGPDFAAERLVRSGRYRSRWDTARIGDFATQALGVPEVTFETPYSRAGELIFTAQAYQDAGKRLALAVQEVIQSGLSA